MNFGHPKIKNALLILMLTFGSVQTPALAEIQHALFTDILSDYVNDGKINYTDLCRDGRLSEYTDQINATDPQSIEQENDRFAFWLNVYNAYSLQAICREYPIESINDLNFGGLIVSVILKKSVWDRPFVMVHDKEYTLREVDHEILRPTFKDSRIQFAIACGAIGCAPSRREAYEGGKIDRQLDEQARKFINDPRLNTFNVSQKKAELSPLFNWSKKDFGGNDRELLLYIAGYLPKEISEHIVGQAGSWKIKYKKYDLTLNDAKN